MAILDPNAQLFAVINPKSGSSVPEQLQNTLDELFGDRCQMYHLTEEIDLTQLIRDKIDAGATHIIAAGGDGTVSAVSAGLINTNIPLGIIPLGSGNGVAQELNIPLDMTAACHLIANSTTTRTIDAIKLNGRYYLLRIGIGFEARIMAETPTNEKQLVGGFAYMWNILKKWRQLRSYKVEIDIDGSQYAFRRITHGALVNCPTLGTPPRLGLTWGDHIQPDDTIIDLCLVKEPTTLDYYQLAWQAWRHQVQHNPQMLYYQAQRTITIDATPPMHVHGDGEALGQTPITAQVIPQALKIIVPDA
ncbi:MAG TPA: YegS/Rv2252/BmrU family lipid kinase [Anaerolineae bacterium]|nr:YegS/Rv2252/BmrU family lipid kinase [Anaerolineae bacterium]